MLVASGGIVGLERFGIALFPMPHQIVIERACPSDATFEEGEAQFRKAPRHAAEQERLTYRLGGGGKWPIWLKTKLEIELRVPIPTVGE